ncbi:MAG TPA: NADH-quinone oxidoreductase subunit N [Candidatus Paraprevotella stercorigallinarum]|jgi:NADH-quinone oxidoreductase subunit N|nr:NADH-quinone oxidoreductase subunit N [Candidatus Paraprevotella stercorigallinarum]
MNIFAILSLHAELWLMAVILLVLVADLFMGSLRKRWFHPLLCVLMCIQIILSVTPDTRQVFGGMYINTPFLSIAKAVLAAGTLLVFLQSNKWLDQKDTHFKRGEFYVLTLCTLLGMFFMLTAGHFLLFYLGLEMASIPMACIVALDKYRHNCAEAGAKFILSSMFSSAFLLYGLSLLYGTCGTLYFADLPSLIHGTALQQFAMVLFIAGIGFKMSLVPFHLWTADVYQGAPTTVSAYLSVISKGAAAVALAGILLHIFGPMKEDWGSAIALLVIVTITIGNLMALLQQDMKRFMAFSSVSQAGYILLGVLAGSAQGMASLLFYLTIYIVANIGVFAVIGSIEQATDGQALTRDNYRGLYKTNPRLTFLMTLCLFSLAGIPPFAGFFSKFFIFSAAFHSGWWITVFIALVNTVISLYYYLLVVKAMYIEEPEEGLSPVPTFRVQGTSRLCMAICLVGVCVLGLLSFIYEGMFHWADVLF